MKKEVYIEYRKAFLVEGEKNTVEYTDNGETIRKTVSYDPIPVEEADKFPLWIAIKQRVYKKSGKIYSWKREGRLAIFCDYASNVPEDEKNVELSRAITYECNAPEVLDGDEIEDSLYEISKITTPLRQQIQEIEKSLEEINKQKTPIQQKCWHSWGLVDERSTGKNSLGEGFAKEWECGVCGKNTTTYHTLLR